MVGPQAQHQFLINGKPDAALTPLDRGFAYGDGVFRTMPVRQGQPIGWRRHYRKLNDDCNALSIVCPSEELLLSDIERLASQEDCVIKIVVTRGESARGYAVPPLAQPSRSVMKSSLPSYPHHYATEGVRLHLCKLRLGAQPRLAGIKHLNRLENVLARMEWRDKQIADGLLMDMAGNVIECTMSNIFMRQGQHIVTPDLSQCGVSGVTRERLIELLPSLGYTVEAAAFGLDALLQADEVIICNSLFGIWQVRQLESHTWQAGKLAEQLRPLLQD